MVFGRVILGRSWVTVGFWRELREIMREKGSRKMTKMESVNIYRLDSYVNILTPAVNT